MTLMMLQLAGPTREFQLRDRDAAFARAGELSEKLARAITWENSVVLLFFC